MGYLERTNSIRIVLTRESDERPRETAVEKGLGPTVQALKMKERGQESRNMGSFLQLDKTRQGILP